MELIERLGGEVKVWRRSRAAGDVLTGAVPGCHTEVRCPSVWHLRLNMLPVVSSSRSFCYFRIVQLLEGHCQAEFGSNSISKPFRKMRDSFLIVVFFCQIDLTICITIVF